MSEKCCSTDNNEIVAFCDNPFCPHSELELNDEEHYHEGDEGVVAHVCGILRSVSVKFTKRRLKSTKKHFFGLITQKEYVYEEKELRLCDICHEAIDTMEEYMEGAVYE